MQSGIESKVDSCREKFSLSVVVPVYKNAETLYLLYERLTKSIKPLTECYELVFVNDACPFGSFEVLKELCGKDKRVVVINLPKNMGQHFAILVGLANSRGDFIIVMDADLQDPPEAVPQLLKVLTSSHHLEVVLATRKGRYESLPRMLTSAIFKSLLQLICGVPKNAGSFCAMKRTVAERILSLPAVKPYLLVLLSATGAKVETITVNRQKRPLGSSAYTEWKRLKLALSALWGLVMLKYLRPNSQLTFEALIKTLGLKRLGSGCETKKLTEGVK